VPSHELRKIGLSVEIENLIRIYSFYLIKTVLLPQTLRPYRMVWMIPLFCAAGASTGGNRSSLKEVFGKKGSHSVANAVAEGRGK
jgi:hypothetical protein